MIASDILFALESEFGEMRWPEPATPVFHQSLSSDAEFVPWTTHPKAKP